MLLDSDMPDHVTRGLKTEACADCRKPNLYNGGIVMFECRADDVLEELIELLKLEKIEENIFRGQSQDLGFGNVYDGQVLGQALSAAYQTVPAERGVRSLHAYFLRPGDARKPIVYNVDCVRDGKSFTTRSVIAIQNGRVILNMAASFQVAETGFDHQDAAPQPAGPEGITSERELALMVADQIPESIREKILCRKAIEIRPVDPINPFAPEKRKPLRYAWFKAVGRLPDDPMVHQYMLAYASNFGLAVTSLYPHGQSFWQPQMQVASQDHAM
jgi:acyl-CoA thioesterase II